MPDSPNGNGRNGQSVPRHLGRLLFNLVVFAAAIWFLWSVIDDVGLQSVGRRIAQAALPLAGLILVLNVARFMLLGLRWEIFVRSEAPIGYGSTLSILMAGNFLGLIAPALRVAGPILRGYYLSKETGRPRARFYGTIVSDQTANFSIFAVAMCISGVITASEGSAGMSLFAGVALVAALMGGLHLGRQHLIRLREGERSYAYKISRAILRRDPLGAESPGLVRRFLTWWDHMIEAMTGSMVGRGTWWPGMLTSAALFTVLAFAQTIAFRAIGAEMTLARAAFAVSTAAFVQVLAASPGGPGVTEASLVLIFLALGVDVESAAAGTFLARMMHYLVLIPWGGLCFWRLQRRYGSAPVENESNGTAPAEA